MSLDGFWGFEMVKCSAGVSGVLLFCLFLSAVYKTRVPTQQIFSSFRCLKFCRSKFLKYLKLVDPGILGLYKVARRSVRYNDAQETYSLLWDWWSGSGSWQQQLIPFAFSSSYPSDPFAALEFPNPLLLNYMKLAHLLIMRLKNCARACRAVFGFSCFVLVCTHVCLWGATRPTLSQFQSSKIR